jgi:mannose-6-phosphate isomerase-like protein (cupin superfamily)
MGRADYCRAMPYETMTLPAARDAVAPDGSDVRVLLAVRGASLAHFELAPGETAHAVVHRTVDEVWYVLAGHGEMWRRLGDDGSHVELVPGVCLTIPVGTRFQFRALGDAPLQVVGTTSPPWPTDRTEADWTHGPWTPTVDAGSG